MIPTLLLCGCLLSSTEPEILYPAMYRGVVALQADDPTPLYFHKWATKNFSILSLNPEQGEYLAKHVESIKFWCLERWGIANYDFSAECRVFCVYDKNTMRKQFNGLDESRVEIRTRDGRIEVIAVWLLLDDVPAKTVPVPISEACLADAERKLGLNYCLIRGMMNLNTAPELIKSELIQLGKQGGSGVFYSKTLFSTGRSGFERLKKEDRKLFDRECMVLCLLLRQEFGQEKFLQFLKLAGRDSQAAIRQVYGFSDFNNFDASFLRYMKNLVVEVSENKTPDSYLEIKAK